LTKSVLVDTASGEGYNRVMLNKQILHEYGIDTSFVLDLQDESKQLDAVKQNGYSIRYISNPSEKVQLETIKQNGDSIRCISNPSEKVQLEAVKQNEYSIRYISNPSEKVQLALADAILKTQASYSGYIHKFTSDKALKYLLKRLVVKDIIE
jgi:hypothetical protein